ncbi:HAD-IIIC family phosphatase [Burkholderia contaminans]|nr:HAD-IIIC family phosphatase [Burkholderia contaminans]
MNVSTDWMAALRDAAMRGEPPDAPTRAALLGVTDALRAIAAGKLVAGLPAGGPRPKTIDVTVLANCTTGNYPHLLAARLAGIGVQARVHVNPYGGFEMALATGRLDGSDPDLVTCLIDEAYFMPEDWNPADADGLAAHLASRADTLRAQVLALTDASRATFVLHTLPLPDTLRNSVISWRARTALSRAWCLVNAAILGLAEDSERVAVIDLVSLLANAAKPLRDARLMHYGHLSFSDDALLLHANEVRRYVQARLGLSRKGLGLDLDNTLWGGVVGELGAERIELGRLYPGSGYRALQTAAARLRSQGVVLALLSKNDAALVDDVLASHPEMVLRPGDFSASAVNWAPKSQGLHAIGETLDLAPDAFVFMDDSAFERGEVAAQWPEVALVAADCDPALLADTLLGGGWFDSLALTDTDRNRPALYRARSDRQQYSNGFASRDDYLHALGIQLVPKAAERFTIARIAQLAARTNQFNLTGERHDDAQLEQMANDPGHFVYSFSARDRFGDDGIVGAVWGTRDASAWRVTNFVLSCRVLGRSIEVAIVGWLATRAREAGARTLEGRYVASPRNAVAAELWPTCGFAPSRDDCFALPLSGAFAPTPAWIHILSDHEVSA